MIFNKANYNSWYYRNVYKTWLWHNSIDSQDAKALTGRSAKLDLDSTRHEYILTLVNSARHVKGVLQQNDPNWKCANQWVIFWLQNQTRLLLWTYAPRKVFRWKRKRFSSHRCFLQIFCGYANLRPYSSDNSQGSHKGVVHEVWCTRTHTLWPGQKLWRIFDSWALQDVSGEEDPHDT